MNETKELRNTSETLTETSKTLIEKATGEGISMQDLLFLLITEPNVTVRNYIKKIKKEGTDSQGYRIMLEVTPTADDEEKIIKYSVKEIADMIYPESIAQKEKDEILDALVKMENDRYKWVHRWSKGLFYFGIIIVASVLIVSGWILYVFFMTLSLMLYSIIPAFALYAIFVGSPAIFASLPSISTSIPWQQIVAASGIIGAVGLSTIITTFIKGSFQEIESNTVTVVQNGIINKIWCKQIKNSKRKLEKDIFNCKYNYKQNNDKDKALACVLKAQSDFFDRETKILKDLINELQNYIKASTAVKES